MASKEEIGKRVESETDDAWRRWDETPAKHPPREAMANAVRPLVERVIELEEENAELRERLDQHAPKLTAAEARIDSLGAALHNMTRERDELGAAMVREAGERGRLTDKLKSAEQRVIELDRSCETLNADRSRLVASLTEARADLRTAHREHDETTAALRAQVAALQGVIDGHEQAIRDACADVRGQMRREVDFWTSRATAAEDRRAALETTVDVLAGRLAARGA